jgi:hypothetical protein
MLSRALVSLLAHCQNCNANPNCVLDLTDNAPALPKNNNTGDAQSKQLALKDSTVKFMGLQVRECELNYQ